MLWFERGDHMLHNFSRKLESADRLETEYLRILYYDLEINYADSYHSYEYTRLCTIVEGEKHIRVNNEKRFTYDTSQFLLLPPQSHVHMTIKRPTQALVFELSDVLIKKVCAHLSRDGDFDNSLLMQDRVLCAHESTGFKEVCQKIVQLLSADYKDSKYMLDLLGQQLVYYLMQTKGAQQLLEPTLSTPVNRAIRFMHESFAAPVSIRQIADELGMSEANFSQYFKKITGISPHAYLTHLRLEKAKELIIHASVTDVAIYLGYDNISHFITLFKNKYGITPGEYKKREAPKRPGSLSPEP